MANEKHTNGPMWTKLWIDAFFGKTRLCSVAGRGAYVSLYCHAVATQAPVKDDDALLSRIIGASIDEWKSIRQEIEPLFEVTENGWTSPEIQAAIRDFNKRQHQTSKARAVRLSVVGGRDDE
jgi:uncharacterized protein YdaU (DUF1376 family)